MPQRPHITVATVVERDGLFLMVKENIDGKIVYNQPAGHLELDESLVAAAQRETQEETGWSVRVTHLLGIYHYTSPANSICYVRHCFIATPLIMLPEVILDKEIIFAVWLSLDEIHALRTELRSPMVITAITDYLQGKRFPLSIINDR